MLMLGTSFRIILGCSHVQIMEIITNSHSIIGATLSTVRHAVAIGVLLIVRQFLLMIVNDCHVFLLPKLRQLLLLGILL